MITGFIIGVVATLVSVIIGAALMTVKKNATEVTPMTPVVSNYSVRGKAD